MSVNCACRIVALLALLLAAAGSEPARAGAPLEASVARDRWGVAHVTARDYAGLGYGYGYALAQDNLCVMADVYMTVGAQRSRFLGPDGSYEFRGNGTSARNLESDFFFQKVIDERRVERLIAQRPPLGPRPEMRELVRGYVAGYNRRLREGVRDPACAGKPWVRPIKAIDVWRHFHRLVLLASSGAAIDGIGGAQPPGGGGGGGPASGPLPSDADLRRLGEGLQGLLGAGSNAVGLGAQATATRRGMVLGNPHFPWDGSERFFQVHLRIPGRLNVSGASLLGTPLVLIGTTPTMAWSHTVSYAYRFTPFQLTLAPDSPTTYLVDGARKPMTARRVTVQARTPAGALEPRSRTLYDTEYGPIFTEVVGQSLFPWTSGTAFAMGDANAANFRVFNHFLEVNRARSVREVDRILRRNQGIPWVNTIAADAGGESYYADISVVPNVPDDHAARCNTAVGEAAFRLLRLPVLDGARSACNWVREPGALQPGTIPPARQPSLFRRDYVINTNDSYWLANPEQPLEGYPRIMGSERAPRSLRGRMGLTLVRERLAAVDGDAGNRFTVGRLADMVFNNRVFSAELWRADVARMCREAPVVLTTGGPVDVREACPVLERFDGRDDLESRGAPLWRRVANRLLAINALPGDPAQGAQPQGVFTVPFDPADPIGTPRGLNTANPQVRAALGDAVRDLRGSSIPLDAPLGAWQYEERGSERIPIHGGPGGVGAFNAINPPFVRGRGWPSIPHGSSFVMVAELAKGCPRLRTVLTYSQATDPTSRWYANQTRMYSGKQWAAPPFCDAQTRRLGARRLAERPR